MSSKGGSPTQSVHERTLDRVTDAIVSLDTHLRLTYLNENAEELLGASASDLVGTKLWDAFPDAAGTIAQDRVETALADQRETSYERYNETVGRWFEARVFPDRDGLSILFTDVTEEKERQRDLERYESIVETLPVAVSQNEPEPGGDFVYVNDGLVEMFDLESRAAAREYAVDDFYVDPDERDEVRQRLQTDGQVRDRVVEFNTATDDRFWGSLTAVTDTVDGEECFIGVIENVSDRKEFEEKLRELHAATREMVSASTQAEISNLVTETAERAIGVETSGVHRYDESADALVPVSVSDRSTELIGDRPTLDEGVAWDAFQRQEVVRYDDPRDVDGLYNEETVFGSELVVPLGEYGVFIASHVETDAFDENDVRLLEILTNNAATIFSHLETKQKLRERERELRRNRDFLDQTARVAKVGGWEVEFETGELEWTDEVYRIHGMDTDEPPSVGEAVEAYHPDDREKIRSAVDRLSDAGEPYDLELRILTTNNNIRWVRTVGIPAYDDSGEAVVAARGIFQDITERREREQDLEQQNDRLNEFVNVISHDLRNPLNVAQARTTILQQLCTGDELDHLDALVDSLDRIEGIIEDTLTLARQGDTVGDLSPVPVVDLAGQCWKGVLTESATLDVVDEFELRGDRSRLQHVFENLFRNAVEHGGEDVTVRVGRAGEASFYIADDGPGIPEAERAAVFEPGQTEDADGTGFGLAIVKRIAEAHGWEVRITDGFDGGARFEFDNVEFVDS